MAYHCRQERFFNFLGCYEWFIIVRQQENINEIFRESVNRLSFYVGAARNYAGAKRGQKGVRHVNLRDSIP